MATYQESIEKIMNKYISGKSNDNETSNFKCLQSNDELTFNIYKFYVVLNLKHMIMKIYLNEDTYYLDHKFGLDEYKHPNENLEIHMKNEAIINNLEIDETILKLYKLLKLYYNENKNSNPITNELLYYLPIIIKLENNIDNFNEKFNDIIDTIKEYNKHKKDDMYNDLYVYEKNYDKYTSDIELLKKYSYSDKNNNFIVNYCKSYNKNFNIIYKLLLNAIMSDRINIIWNPSPNFSDIDYNIIENTTLLKYIVKNLIKMYDTIHELEDDFQLYKIFPMSYLVLKFSIKHFTEYNIESWETDAVGTKNVELMKVVYEDSDKTFGFSDTDDKLFHGSTNQNWFSIMFNGLKTGTKNNKLFLNGSAYGKGVYLSSTSRYSYDYSCKTSAYSNKFKDFSTEIQPLLNSNKNINKLLDSVIIGVFAIKDNMKKHKKSGNIYVVKDEELLQLQYLLMMNRASYSNYNNFTNIDNYFTKKIKDVLINQKIKTDKIGNKRLMKEIINIQKQNGIIDDSGLLYFFNFNDENMTIITFDLPLDNFEKDSDIYKDLVKYGYESVKVEMDIQNGYPFNPPFVRIISPRFKFMTGHITSGGSICMEILTNQGWSAALDLLKVLIVLKLEMIAGGARLDPRSHSKTYTITEAKDAYKRMLKSHGWN